VVGLKQEHDDNMAPCQDFKAEKAFGKSL
jgi:hypothetical protein